jgi:hypothetical protein
LRPRGNRAAQTRQRDGEAAVIGHGDAARQDVIVSSLDLVQDAAVQPERGGHARPGDGGEHGNPRCGPAVDRPSARYQVRQCPPHLAIRLSGSATPGQQFAIHTERRQLVGGEIYPSPVEILPNVPEEVGDLEGDAERSSVRFGTLPRYYGAQNRKHLQPDHRSRAVDVMGKLVKSPVASYSALLDRPIHAHRDHKIGEVLRIYLVAHCRVHRRGKHGMVRTALC